MRHLIRLADARLALKAHRIDDRAEVLAELRRRQGIDRFFSAPPSAASDPAMPIIPVIPEADAMGGLLMRRADALVGCHEGSGE